jgi:hypothetical protein
MKFMKVRRFVVTSLLIGAFACASAPIKQQAVVTLGASERALEAAHDAERLLCNPGADQTTVITTCNGPGADLVKLTSEKHVQLAGLFSKAFATEILAAKSLQAWRSGEPAPSSIADYQRDINAILSAVVSLLPEAKDLISKTQKADVEAKKTAAAVSATK